MRCQAVVTCPTDGTSPETAGSSGRLRILSALNSYAFTMCCDDLDFFCVWRRPAST